MIDKKEITNEIKVKQFILKKQFKVNINALQFKILGTQIGGSGLKYVYAI